LAGLNRLAAASEWAAAQEHTSLGQRKISHQNLASRQTFAQSLLVPMLEAACESDGKNWSAYT
jgi:hypothetical protein